MIYYLGKDDITAKRLKYEYKNENIVKISKPISLYHLFFSHSKIIFHEEMKRKHRWFYILCKFLGFRLQAKKINNRNLLTNFIGFVTHSSWIITTGRHITNVFLWHYPNAYITHSKTNLQLFILIKLSLYLKKFTKNSKTSILICSDCSSSFISKIATLNNLDITIRFYDKIGQKPFSSEHVKSILKICGLLNINTQTYSRSDSKNYNISYVPNKVRNISNKIYNRVTNPTYECLFMGTVNSKRLEQIFDLFYLLKYHLIKSKFILYLYEDITTLQLEQLFSYIEKYPESIELINDGSNYSYQEYINLVFHSKVLIDFIREEFDEGFSYRVSEAVVYNKGLITDRDLQNESFYIKDNIFSLNDENNHTIDSFLNKNEFIWPNKETLML